MALFHRKPAPAPIDGSTFDRAREEMVEHQIAGRGVHDQRILEAMRDVPRHYFVPVKHWGIAYDDRPIPIGKGQTISQPYMVAAMSAALELTGEEHVLEVGTGSGYQAAILSRLAKSVDTIERMKYFVDYARERFRLLGIENVRVHHGDGSLGYPEGAPFDRIIVTAGAPHLPEDLTRQLAVNGRLVCPVGDRESQRLQIIRRTETGLERRESMSCAFVPLRGADAWPEEDKD